MSSMATKFLLTPFSSRSCGRAAFLLCCHGNAACIHPWSCLSPSCRGPVCIPPWSCLFPPLVLPASLPGSAAAECHQAPPSGLPGGSPISANTGQNIIRDEKREREEGAPAGYSICLCRSLAAAAGARASVQVRFIKPAPASEWRRVETATETRTAGIAACGGSRTMAKAEGGQ